MFGWNAGKGCVEALSSEEGWQARALDGRAWLIGLLLTAGLLVSGGAQAQIFSGSNYGPIPDGTGNGPLAYGAPRDIRFNVGGLIGSVGQARVFFRANHSWVGDLKVQLIAPDGRAHLLFERSGATTPTSGGFNANLVSSAQYLFGNDFTGVSGTNWWTAADIGDNDIATADLFTPVISGDNGVANPAPITSMDATFGTGDPNGVWTLRFEDGWVGDTGDVTLAELILPSAGVDRLVSNANDTGTGSLREAMSLAQAGDAIRFALPFFNTPRTINLQSALPLLPDGVGIFGPGAHLLTVRRDSAGEFRIFELASGTQATISGMTIANGSVPTLQGGGIFSSGRLTVIGSVIRDNVAQGGGGITNLQGDLTLLRSTVVGNSAAFGAGVRIRNNATALIDNSTISAQGGDRVGLTVIAQGGLSSSLILRNSTLTDTGGAAGIGLAVQSQGAGSLASARISNCLFATAMSTIVGTVANGAPPPVILSEGFNLATDGANGFLTQSSDRTNGNAPMEPLFDHGGGIPVHRPALTSDALDNGRATGPRLSDQTGIFERVTDLQDGQYPNAVGGDGSDIGAFELPEVPSDVIFANGME